MAGIARPAKDAYQKRYVILEHELDSVRKCSALGEVDEVFQRERQVNVLRHLDVHSTAATFGRVISHLLRLLFRL
jgi:hypothetical protein